ncbi:MAG: PA0069 family radical SAM protein, partial [Janthinobacterium lividum]
LDAHHPDRAARVMSLVQSMRGGRDNPGFGARMKGDGPYAAMLHRRVALAKARLGLDRPRLALRCDLFAVPGEHQLALL